MFCRNCGSEMADNAAICVKCGVAKGEASSYCPNCGSETNENAAVCVSCGVALKNSKQSTGAGLTEGAKSKMVAGLLAIFLGHLVIHEFYLCDKKKATRKIIATIISVILCVVGVGVIALVAIWAWNIYDAVMIFTNKRTDADGNALS